MGNNFTLRDFLVYVLVGFFAFGLIFFHFSKKSYELINSLKDFSNFSLFVFIPICYLLGHFIMGIDDILFNKLISFPLRNRKKLESKKFWEIYNWIFLSYRNNGVKWQLNIDKDDFLKKCDKLIDHKIYDKADYYRIISDLFKGILLCLFLSMIYNLIKFEFYFVELLLLIIAWYRAKIYSSYYVKMIERN